MINYKIDRNKTNLLLPRLNAGYFMSSTQLQPSSEPISPNGLKSRSFIALMMTQFLGAWNDNMFRWLLVPVAKEIINPGGNQANDQGTALVLSIGLALLVLPYVLFMAPAGYLSDRYSKRSVMVACKAAEIFIMALGIWSIYLGNLYFLFAVMFLMGTQSAVFSPAKYGSLPEILKSEKISAGNGLIGLTTILAVVCGTASGLYLYGLTEGKPQLRLGAGAASLVGMAIVGFLASLLIGKLPVAAEKIKFPINIALQTWKNLKLLIGIRAILRVAMGAAFFWSLASLSQLNLDIYVVKEIGDTQQQVGIALAMLSLGVGLGSVLAGFLSGKRVELGLVPLGAFGIVLSTFMLYLGAPNTVGEFNQFNWYFVYFCLVLLGTSGGFFEIPLASYMQHRSPSQHRGSILAAGNFLTFSGMLLVSVLFYILNGELGLKGSTIFLVTAIGTVPVLIYTLILLPWATARFIVWLLSHTIYRVKIINRDLLPETGGALLVANHVTWIDGILLLMISSRPIRLIAATATLGGPLTKRVANLFGVIQISSGPKSIRTALDTARQAIENGELVCIFAEGGITRTGELQPFRRGVMQIVKDSTIPVVPVCLDQLWGSIFSYERGRFFWKWPKKWPYPVSIIFGEKIIEPEDVDVVRNAVIQLSEQSEALRNESKKNEREAVD